MNQFQTMQCLYYAKIQFVCFFKKVALFLEGYLFILSRNFFDWFTVGEGDQLLVLTLLPTPITWTTPSVLLELNRTIFHLKMSFNHKRIGKNMTDFRTSQK